MDLVRRLTVLACAALLAVPALAAASPQAVIDDWADNGRFDAHHTIEDLREAPKLQEQFQQADVPRLLAAVQRKIDEELLGIPPDPGATPDAPSIPNASMPAWAIAGAIGAGLLGASGIASSIILRLRRRDDPAQRARIT